MSRVEPLVLRAGDEKILRGWLRSSTVSAGLAKRARILVLAAEGHSNSEIGRRVGVSLPTVRARRNRYTTRGLAQLGRPAPLGSPGSARRAGDHRRHVGPAAGEAGGDALVGPVAR